MYSLRPPCGRPAARLWNTLVLVGKFRRTTSPNMQTLCTKSKFVVMHWGGLFGFLVLTQVHVGTAPFGRNGALGPLLGKNWVWLMVHIVEIIGSLHPFESPRGSHSPRAKSVTTYFILFSEQGSSMCSAGFGLLGWSNTFGEARGPKVLVNSNEE